MKFFWLALLIVSCGSSPPNIDNYVVGIENNSVKPTARGAGVVFNGDIFTANHLVEGGDFALIYFYDKGKITDHPATAKVVARSYAHDLARLEVKVPRRTKGLELYSGELDVGKSLLLVGHPAGLMWLPTLHRILRLEELISMKGSTLKIDVMVLQGASYGGSSGGGLFREGKLVAIHIGRMSNTGINYAISTKFLKEVMP